MREFAVSSEAELKRKLEKEEYDTAEINSALSIFAEEYDGGTVHITLSDPN